LLLSRAWNCIFVPEWLGQLMLQLRAFRHPSLPENFVVFDLPIQLLYEIVWSFLTFAVDFNSLFDTNSPVCRCHSPKSTGLTCLRSNWTEVTLPGAASGWYTIRFNLDRFISVLARALFPQLPRELQITCHPTSKKNQWPRGDSAWGHGS